jgi:WD40 repeat protein
MEQSDVFVSYRRNDVEFAKQLVKALQGTGREVWVDWEDIPPGVEGFSDEIQRGIEATDAFIAILSPSYLQSPYCLMELREALRLKKRVVPVVLKKFDPEPPPEGIGHINWVYFTPHAGQDNSFDESFPKVIEALEADHDHARQHTRLLTRAIEWEKRQRENSYLLKGTEIDQAESWQVQASVKIPAPTELQLKYILDSRKQQRTQQRRITMIVGVLMVLAVIAAGYAAFQTYQANIAAQVNHSNALASAALQPGNEDIAVALALEAVHNKHAPEQAYQALKQAVYPEGGIRYFMHSDDDVYEYLLPAISPDGRYVVIKNRMYDLTTGKVVQEFKDAPKLTLTGLFLPDGKRVILAGDRDVEKHSPEFIYLGLYDVATGKLLQKYDAGTGISKVQISADGKTLIAFQADSKVCWWDIKSGKKIWEFEGNSSGEYGYAFSSDLNWMAKSYSIYEPNEAGEYKVRTELSIVNTHTMQTERIITGFEHLSPGIIEFSNNSKELAILTWNPDTYEDKIYLIGVEDSQIISNWVLDSGVESIRFSPDDTSLVTTHQDQAVNVWSAHGELIYKQTIHNSPTFIADYVRQGESIVSMDTSGVVITWDLMPGNAERQMPTDERLAAITPDGRYLILEGFTPEYQIDHLSIRDTKTLDETYRLPINGIPPDPGDGSSIYASVGDYALNDGMEKGLFTYSVTVNSPEYELISSTVYVANLADGKIIRTITMPKGISAGTITLSPSDNRIYILNSDTDGLQHLNVWSLKTGDVIDDLIEPSKAYVDYVLRSQGDRLLISRTTSDENNGAITGASVQMIDVNSHKVLFEFESKRQISAFFTPDGSQFVVAEGSELGEFKSNIMTYNAETVKILHQYNIDTISQAIFEVVPDGKSFVTSVGGGGAGGGYNATPSGVSLRTRTLSVTYSFRQWDWSTGELIWEFPEQTDFPFFSPDGKQMFSMLRTSLVAWRFDTHDELIRWACDNRYVPEFTDQQRERFDIKNKTSICQELGN